MQIANWVLPAALLGVLLAAAGCKFKPSHDMEEQPSIHPAYKPSPVFADGASARPVPPGAVPRLPADSPGHPYADLRDTIPAYATPAATATVIPLPVTRDLLLRGQQRYNIYCSECHGRIGDGNGMIVQRGFTPPPSFHIDRLRQVPDATLYNTISNGYGAMFSYADRVKPEDRWAIVAYVRALQASSAPENKLARLTDADRRKLEGKRP